MKLKLLNESVIKQEKVPEDPVFSTPGQSARLGKKLFLNEIEPIKALCGKSFFSGRTLCLGVLKTGSSGTRLKYFFYCHIENFL
jgi:hypothetical protein